MKIESKSNEKFKFFLSLLETKSIRREGAFLLSGKKLVKEFLNKYSKDNHQDPKFKIKGEIRSEGQKALTQFPQYEFSVPLFSELDLLGTHENILWIEYSPLTVFDLTQKPKGLVLISPIGDPRNLGGLFRCALAFEINEVVLTQEAVHPYHPITVKASSGASLNLNIYTAGNLKDCLKLLAQRPENISMALAKPGKSLNQIKIPKDLYLIMGEEGPGYSDAQLDKIQCIEIPISEKIESLNVSHAAALVCWEWWKSNSN